MLLNNIILEDVIYNHWIINGLLALTISLLITGILIPRILLISYRKKLFDIPCERKIHRAAVPRLGGMAFMPAIVLTLSIIIGFNILLRKDRLLTVNLIGSQQSVQMCFGLCALMIMYLIGLADDLIGVKYRAKFVAQILAALLIAASGLTINNLGGFLGIYELPYMMAVTLTVIVIVLLINAINLIDGIDGLASGLSAIAMTFYAFVCYVGGSNIYFLIALAALGTLIPFYYYNVFGNQKVGKKIFMGDTGALTSGVILSMLAIETSNLPATDRTGLTNPLVIGFSPLVVPALDVIRVFFRRIRNGHSPFEPDRAHIHHKFLDLGMRQHTAMLTIIGISAATITINIFLSTVISSFLILTIDIILWIALNLALDLKLRNRRQCTLRPIDTDRGGVKYW